MSNIITYFISTEKMCRLYLFLIECGVSRFSSQKMCETDNITYI